MIKNNTTFKVNNEKRENQCILIHYNAVDPLFEGNWIDVLGEKTFVYWMKLLTLGDCLDENTFSKKKGLIPLSIQKLSNLLNISKSTLYRIVIKPLWNHGLIDLEESIEENNGGTKAINIIVYQYPKNHEFRDKALIKIRDYDRDYSSESKSAALVCKTSTEIN